MASKRLGNKLGKRKKRRAVASIGAKPIAAVALGDAAKAKAKPRKTKPRKTTAKTKPRRRAGGRAGPPVDKAARRRAEQLIAKVDKRKQRVARDFYAMGQALEALSRPRMYGALGYDSFEELLMQRELVSRTAAFKLISVARAYPRKQALELGLEKAYGLIRWSRAAGSKQPPSDLAARDVLIGNQRVRDITVRALAEQAKRAQGESSADGRARSRQHAERIARHMQREMRAQGLEGAEARARRVRGQWHVTVDVLASDAEAWLRDGA